MNGLKAQAEDSLGMAMVYTLAGYLQESLAELVRERKERIAKAEAEAYRLAEEVRLSVWSQVERALRSGGCMGGWRRTPSSAPLLARFAHATTRAFPSWPAADLA